MKEKGWPSSNAKTRANQSAFRSAQFTAPARAHAGRCGECTAGEFAGIEAAIRLFNEVDPAQLRGTLKVCMIYNLPAFVNHLGFLVPHDGKNPMRTFPGSPIGTYGEAMACYFTHEFLSQADYMVELHGGDIPESLTPFNIHPVTGNGEVDEKSKAMAIAYNIPLVVAGKASDPSNPPRSAFGTTALRGKPAILCESGQQGILDLAEVETHLVGLRNVLIHLGMTMGQIVNTVKRTFIADYTSIRSEIDGMWHPSVKLNDRVKKDQVVGRIRDYFGQDILEIKAQLDGIVTVIRTSPAVKAGNVLVEHGRVVGQE
jgi:predicted deacylase